MTDDRDLEAALRASLTERGAHAPAGDGVAERIITGVDHAPVRAPRRGSSRWRAWTLPVVAAGSVAAIAAALVGVNQFRHSADHRSPAGPATSQTPTAPPPTASRGTATPTASAPSPTSTAAATPTATVPVPGLTGVHLIDLTFVGTELGWALGSADCLDGSGQPCTAMIRTTDGGHSWSSMKPPPANIPLLLCAEPCIRQIRFATPRVGYAFGPSALFMTVDGGGSWRRLSGGAEQLETLDSNVIRVVTASACAPPGCRYSVETAPVGSDTWTAVPLPGAQPAMSVGVTLARTGTRSFIDVFGHVAGGAQEAHSVLFTSTDDGASWTNRGEPCPQVGGERTAEVDTTALTTAADGSATILCTGRGDQDPQFTMTSTDGGRSFTRGELGGLGAAPVSAVGAASATTLLVMAGDAFRSTNAGATWQRLQADGGSSPGLASWIGFESPTVGRATDGRTIWTTTDTGLTWTAYAFR